MIEYTNVPKTIGTVVSSGLATLNELDTIYGTADLWWLLEINTVNVHNKRIAQKTS